MIQIKTILETKPHNLHYLNRYINFISYCKEVNLNLEKQYTENHHILPKSKDMFPEYASFKLHPWNSAVLTFRQHIIAHYLLMKTYNTQSQILSVLRTGYQKHATHIKLNSRMIEKAKTELSKNRKGKFTRGYRADGTPNVSEESKKKISEQKTLLYASEENRKKHSIACTGSKRTNTEGMKIYSKNRTVEHKENLKEAIRTAWAVKKENGDTKRVKGGIYVTPVGNFTSSLYGVYCKNPDKIITIHQTKKNEKLNPSVIGLTPRELGFFFVSIGSPSFEQYCVDLNLAHPPEPNHPLLSELNDFLLREKFLR